MEETVPFTTANVVRSREVLALRVENNAAYEKGFKAGLLEAAECDHLSLLVSQIFEGWLREQFPKLLRTCLESEVSEAAKEGVLTFLREKGLCVTLKLREYYD